MQFILRVDDGLTGCKAIELERWIDNQYPVGMNRQQFLEYFPSQDAFRPEHATLMREAVQTRRASFTGISYY